MTNKDNWESFHLIVQFNMPFHWDAVLLKANPMELSPFMRSRQSLSHSRIFQHFMKPWVSLPCSQEIDTGTYPKPDYPNPNHPVLFP
jgi:hypothetical protein